MTHSNHETNPVTVVGAEWCGDTRAAVAALEGMGVAFDFVDVDEDPGAAEWVREQNGGKIKLPTVKVGRQVLSVPDSYQLQAAVQEYLP